MPRALRLSLAAVLLAITAILWVEVARAQGPPAANPPENTPTTALVVPEQPAVEAATQNDIPGEAANTSDTPAPRLSRPQIRNLRRAEALAKRSMQRLKETMDVEVVYREMVVPNVVWRHRLSDDTSILDALGDELQGSCDDDNLERYALAITNLFWAYGAYVMTTQDVSKMNDFGPLRDAAPADVRLAVSQARYFAPLGERKFNLGKIQTREELLEVIQDAQALREVVLKHIPQHGFDSELYRKNVKYLARNGRKSTVGTDTKQIYSQTEEVEIYQVWADFLPLAVVDVEGELKILTLAN
jgi:hypothetical protein